MTDEEARELAEKHWEYSKRLIDMGVYKPDKEPIIPMSDIRWLCIEHFVHGAKHQRGEK